MPYIRGIGYVKTGPRPRKRLAEIESHNAAMGTTSSGYSQRTRPDNICLRCNYVWVPRARNLSQKCPNCKKSTLISSREAFEPQFPKDPQKPSYWDSFVAKLQWIIPIISILIVINLLETISLYSIIISIVIAILNYFAIVKLKKKAKEIFEKKISFWEKERTIWLNFCKNVEYQHKSWFQKVKTQGRSDYRERNWDFSQTDYHQPFIYGDSNRRKQPQTQENYVKTIHKEEVTPKTECIICGTVNERANSKFCESCGSLLESNEKMNVADNILDTNSIPNDNFKEKNKKNRWMLYFISPIVLFFFLFIIFASFEEGNVFYSILDTLLMILFFSSILVYYPILLFKLIKKIFKKNNTPGN